MVAHGLLSIRGGFIVGGGLGIIKTVASASRDGRHHRARLSVSIV
jgi:hypothetical protein